MNGAINTVRGRLTISLLVLCVFGSFHPFIPNLRITADTFRRRLTSLDRDQILLLQFLSGNWILSIVVADVLQDQLFLVHQARFDRDNGVLRGGSRDCKIVNTRISLFFV